MKTIATYKDYLIVRIGGAPKLGDYEARYFSIRNAKTKKEFKYLVKVSGTLEAVKNINSDKKFVAHALPYIKNLLDKKFEKTQEILITTYSEKEKKAKGIFYTPVNVEEFIFDILSIWKAKQITRWQARTPSVIDPAAGEGGFLKVALDKGFTKPDWVFGIDIDINAVKKWKEVNLLKEFGGNEDDLEAHFFHQNGLEKVKWGQHKNKYYGRLKKVDINNEQFDCVVGNPPYGGVGLGETELTDDIIAQLAQYEVLPKQIGLDLGVANSQTDLFGAAKSLSLKPEAKQKIKSFPIEILFIDRFIQLTKPGGWVAIIIPDGILTNSNSHYVREFISHKTKVEAIVSLPRNTFKEVGTNAKTSILFLKKLKNKEKLDDPYPVFLATLQKVERDNFIKIVNSYEKFYNLGGKHMDKSNLIQITKDQAGKEVVMVRADKNMKDLMEERPSSRWDPEYWHPKHALNFGDRFKVRQIGDFIEYITYGTILTGKDRGFTKSGVCYISSTTVTDTGINHHLNPLFVDSADRRNKKDKKPQTGDIILNRSGVGTLGRQCVFTYLDNNWTISDDTDLIRLTNISPYYVSVFLKTKFGMSQIEQRMRGVSGLIKLNFEDIKAITIPELSPDIQKNIEGKYKQMAERHNEAVDAKTRGDLKNYDKELGLAKEILNGLIKMTEELIENKREDVD